MSKLTSLGDSERDGEAALASTCLADPQPHHRWCTRFVGSRDLEAEVLLVFMAGTDADGPRPLGLADGVQKRVTEVPCLETREECFEVVVISVAVTEVQCQHHPLRQHAKANLNAEV